MQGECRKASADKEPTQDLNTLGGSDHVRIDGLLQLPPTSKHMVSIPGVSSIVWHGMDWYSIVHNTVEYIVHYSTVV